MTYIIGVDAGGTKTSACLFDPYGKLCHQASSSFGNPLMDELKALQHVKEAIAPCFQLINKGGDAVIIVGAAGVQSGTWKEVYKKHISSYYAVPSFVMNDAELMYYAVHEGNDGVVTIAGTGSVSIGAMKGEIMITGGWGPLLGDMGSGYSIALEACKHFIYEYEHNLPVSRLSHSIREYWSLESPQSLKEIIYRSSKDEVATLSQVVSALAETGDENALSILRQAGQILAEQTVLLHNKLGAEIGTLPIAGKGSVLEKNKFVQQIFSETINSSGKIQKIVYSEVEPAKGAYYYWQKLKQRDGEIKDTNL
ncbi:BadF/BadG/BcrA/BcrD ATPase family protein [Alteribacillus sp. HJP-4]|uniref:BadF/BadG/BcrA/BcrD ATPase family protein n=1 Tax=Alteribacillus sp. HJP-4 TaxID=2775394 RepID=UPI0035CCD5F3